MAVDTKVHFLTSFTYADAKPRKVVHSASISVAFYIRDCGTLVYIFAAVSDVSELSRLKINNFPECINVSTRLATLLFQHQAEKTRLARLALGNQTCMCCVMCYN